MMLALVLTTWAVARARRDYPALPDRLTFRRPSLGGGRCPKDAY
jgi:hypothetical protein